MRGICDRLATFLDGGHVSGSGIGTPGVGIDALTPERADELSDGGAEVVGAQCVNESRQVRQGQERDTVGARLDVGPFGAHRGANTVGDGDAQESGEGECLDDGGFSD